MTSRSKKTVKASTKATTKASAEKTVETAPSVATMDTMDAMRARIAELEAKNVALKNVAPVPAPQGQDNVRKNATENLVRATRSGNVRTDFDPSPELVAEAAAQGGVEGS